MKKFLFLVLIFTVTNCLQAQEGVNQELDTTIVKNNRNVTSYKLILEYGASTGIEHYYYKGENIEEIGTKYSGFGFSLTAINNIAFYNKFLLGIGGGIEYRSFMITSPMELSGTCFFNFRHYFNKPDRVLIPMLNIAIGGRMTKEFDGFMANNPWHLSETMYGIYSTFGAGFKVKRLSVQGGVLFWTKGYDLYGIDAMVKIGLNF